MPTYQFVNHSEGHGILMLQEHVLPALAYSRAVSTLKYERSLKATHRYYLLSCVEDTAEKKTLGMSLEKGY